MNTVARDILDIFVVHDRVDQAVAKEVLVHVVEDLFTLDRGQFDTEIPHDVVAATRNLPLCFLFRDIFCIDIERFKQAFLQFF